MLHRAPTATVIPAGKPCFIWWEHWATSVTFVVAFASRLVLLPLAVLTLVELNQGASGVKYLRLLFQVQLAMAAILALDVLLCIFEVNEVCEVRADGAWNASPPKRAVCGRLPKRDARLRTCYATTSSADRSPKESAELAENDASCSSLRSTSVVWPGPCRARLWISTSPARTSGACTPRTPRPTPIGTTPRTRARRCVRPPAPRHRTTSRGGAPATQRTWNRTLCSGVQVSIVLFRRMPSSRDLSVCQDVFLLFLSLHLPSPGRYRGVVEARAERVGRCELISTLYDMVLGALSSAVMVGFAYVTNSYRVLAVGGGGEGGEDGADEHEGTAGD